MCGVHWLTRPKKWRSSDVIKAPLVQPDFVYFFRSAKPYSINFGSNNHPQSTEELAPKQLIHCSKVIAPAKKFTRYISKKFADAAFNKSFRKVQQLETLLRLPTPQ